MKIVVKICVTLIVIILVVYFSLRLIWFVQPKQSVNVYILDKTVTSSSYSEHCSLTWLLNNHRFVGPDQKTYSVKNDYMGFYPIDLEKEQFDFKTVRLNEVDAFAAAYDLAYYTDCYGVFSFEWYKNFKAQNVPSSKVYGGLNQNDYLLLKKMRDNDKVIIGEYSLFGTPTNALIRNKVEELFNLTWSGWSGKYFFSLNPNHTNGPANWMPKLYESQHLKPWPADETGIVLVNNDGLIDVLLLDEDLNSFTPTITATADGIQKYKLPQTTDYAGWFEFVTAGEGAQIEASFNLNLTDAGCQHLAKIGLPTNFPAIIKAQTNEPTFYFAGDFAENKVCNLCAKIYGGKAINRLLVGDKLGNNFFSNFYSPLIESIIEEYCIKK